MKGTILTAALAALSVNALAAEPAETPAKPKFRTPPAYPAACLASAKPGDIDRVIVAYAVDEEGRTRNERVRETSDACFNDSAVSAVKSWEFEPRRVNGKRSAQEDVETLITYKFETPTEVVDFDARPIKRTPPRYPESCMDSAKEMEFVIVEFDVTPEGTTTNIRAVDATYDCLKKAAERSVIGWKYSPMLIDGAPALRKGVQTRISFELVGGPDGVSSERVRQSVWNALQRVERLASSGKDFDKAAAELNKIEEKYGADFSRDEQAAFHLMRGRVRIGQKDYAGALDDLVRARALGVAVDDREKMDKLIQQLEQAVAASAATKPPPAPPADDTSAGIDASQQSSAQEKVD